MSSRSAALFLYAVRLLRPFWKAALFATLMGGLASLATVSLLSIIDRELRAEGGVSETLVWSFAGLALLLLASEIASGVGNSFVGQNVIAEVRKDLAKKILSAPIAEIERAQAHRVIAALSRDVGMISEFTRGLTYLVIAFFGTLGCIVYLTYLSWPMFLVTAAAGASVYIAIRYILRKAHGDLSLEREAANDLQKHYRALVEGAKELRLNRRRRVRFYDAQLLAAINRMRDLSNRAFTRFVISGALDSTLFFIVAGTLICVAPYIGANKSDLAAYVLVLMYLKGPMSQIVFSLPMFSQALVSFESIAELSEKFVSSEPNLFEDKPMLPDLNLEFLELRKIAYTFPASAGVEPFTLGPIDLAIRPGEIVFITGENGSGKTTLVKLILGLYEPMAGEIFFNRAAVTESNLDDYRQYFSAIFFDFYLFGDVVAADDTARKAVDHYLKRLDIAHKVAIESGAFSTTDLSAGQRKRLALIETYLEQRPIIVFDEWAAEQDPTFRRIFYTEILPELKRQGKTLIAVSHDDRYFGAADRVIRIDHGCIAEQPFMLTS